MIQSRFMNRRSLVAGVASLAATGLWVRRTSGNQPGPVMEGDCEEEPAIAMLFDWRAGRSVYRSVADAGPQIGWEPFHHPSALGPFLIPPGWTGVAAWADSFTREGVPEWQARPLALPQLTLSRIVSPDGEAAFEYAVGSIQQVLLDTGQAATIAKQSMVGESPRLRPVCTIDDANNQLMPAWFTVDRHRSSLLTTFGNVAQLPDHIVPATVVSFTTMYGPRRDMEDLM